MPSTHSPPSKSAVNKKLVVIGAMASRKTSMEAVEKTAHSDHAITADDKSSRADIPDAGSSVADGADEELSTAEQKLLDELQEIITTYGPLEGAVKIKLPDTAQHIAVHGCLLMGKSSICRAKLINNVKKGGPRELELPATSVATVAYFLKWVYNDNILPTHGRVCSCCAEHSVTWPSLINLWNFARKMSMPKLQNHAVDILVRKIHGSLELNNVKDEETDHRRAAFNLLWPGKHQTRDLHENEEALGPLRRLMMDWFANPMYQTKAEANQLWAGGISRGFYRDYALYSIQKNFSRGDCVPNDEDDRQEHLEAMEEVTRHDLGCYWKIKPEKYHVDDNTFAAPYNLY